MLCITFNFEGFGDFVKKQLNLRDMQIFATTVSGQNTRVWGDIYCVFVAFGNCSFFDCGRPKNCV